ncbi:MAG: zf-HC2 domain-containing protein, partial [Bryobacteraceae bacterium]
MSECWDEGGLRAYFDRELTSEDLSRIAAHIGVCAECHARYNELAARAVRVSSMMSALGVAVQIAPMPAPFRRRWVQ